eukprot:GHVU01205673.1.p1 GENE.GHVU01205673.1~~GHVU01205673.1.p1  ORF type:complete len:137 (+),score=7.24 GHVU01205673.1:35-445(+)
MSLSVPMCVCACVCVYVCVCVCVCVRVREGRLTASNSSNSSSTDNACRDNSERSSSVDCVQHVGPLQAALLPPKEARAADQLLCRRTDPLCLPLVLQLNKSYLHQTVLSPQHQEELPSTIHRWWMDVFGFGAVGHT